MFLIINFKPMYYKENLCSHAWLDVDDKKNANKSLNLILG